MHRLRLRQLDLVGGDRTINFRRDISAVRGPIATGKTTLVRLLRATLGSVPDGLAPETQSVRALQAEMELDSGRWRVYRPLVSTDTAKVELAQVATADADDNVTGQQDPLDALRLPAVRSDVPGGATYNGWLLEQLGLPSIEVPRARTQVTSDTTPVTINDWLGYCIIPGDEIDTSVFGHNVPWRETKRRYVFEINYGLYDVQTAILQKELREVELNRIALAQQEQAANAFLQDTAFADPLALRKSVQLANERLVALSSREASIAAGVHSDLGTAALRDRVQAAEEGVSDLRVKLRRTQSQLGDLRDLRTQLMSQSARLTRAIVAGEWLIDFDFVVCPRCGNKVDPTRVTDESDCYLCLQPLRPSDSRESIISEQERVAAQVRETDEVIGLRERDLTGLMRATEAAESQAQAVSAELEQRTRAFINEQASALASLAAERERLLSQVQRAEELLAVLHRRTAVEDARARLDSERERLLAALERRGISEVSARDHIAALEQRFYDYLARLNIPFVGDRLTATIDRRTLMPVVSGRRFDELSSQGLEVLVNVAHALAHHTVSIDRDLVLPGFLVLDGLSSNVGREGFDAARVDDMYRLILDVAEQYDNRLQIIAVDNDPPHYTDEYVVLSLDENDRLIQADLE